MELKTMKYQLCIVFIICLFHLLHGFKSDKGPSLNERIGFLKDVASKKTIISFNSARFKDYIKWPGRNYSFVIMFTALEPQRQCSICQGVYEEFMITAKSFHVMHGLNDKLFFGMIDYDEGAEIFQSLDIKTAPMIVHVPPKKKISRVSDFHQLDMQRVGFSAESVARWITERTGYDFKIFRPPNYVSTIGLLTLFFLGSVVIYFKQENFEFLKNRTIWAIITIGICLTMTSGQMWNHIRGPPFYHRSSNGISYIHGSSQGQFVSETYLIFILNACFITCIITIIENGYGTNNSTGMKISTSAALLFGSLLFSAVLSIFKAKAGGYPYRGLL